LFFSISFIPPLLPLLWFIVCVVAQVLAVCCRLLIQHSTVDRPCARITTSIMMWPPISALDTCTLPLLLCGVSGISFPGLLLLRLFYWLGIFMAIFGFTTLYIALMCMHGVETPDVWMSKDDPGWWDLHWYFWDANVAVIILLLRKAQPRAKSSKSAKLR
jgi:hypothetical protein